MHNRIEIARDFATSINSEKIIKIILFWSVVRQEDTEDSDIWDMINDVAFQIVLDKQEVISPHIASESNLNQIKDFSIIRNVMGEGIVIG